MTKVKFRVQWIALLCLAALLVGALSVFLFRDTVAAEDTPYSSVDDFSTLAGQKLEHTPGSGDTKNVGNQFSGSTKWSVMLYNQTEGDPPYKSNDTAKGIYFETVTGNDGGAAVRLFSAYKDPANCIHTDRSHDSVRFFHNVGLNLKDGCGFVLHFRFMVPDTNADGRFFLKANSKEWPGNLISFGGSTITVGYVSGTDKGTALQTEVGHWYDFTMIYSEKTKSTTLVLDGIEYKDYNEYASFDYNKIDYPIFQCQRSLTGDSTIYLDDYQLFELAEDYSVLTHRMQVSSELCMIGKDKVTVFEGTTLSQLTEGIAKSYDTEIHLMDGETEVTSASTVITSAHTLVFQTKNGVYRVTLPCEVLPNSLPELDAADLFNGNAFTVTKDTVKEDGYYKGSATDLLTGVPSSVTLGEGDTVSVGTAPFLTGDNRALILASSAASSKAELRILRAEAFPYESGYGHILEFDVLAAAAGGELTLKRTGVSDAVTVDKDGITFAGKSAPLTGRYAHVTWEITAAGMQNVYVDGTLLAQKSLGSALTSAGGLTVELKKDAAVDAKYILDNLTSYVSLRPIDAPKKDTTSPTSSAVSINEGAGTYFVQVDLLDVEYLLGTFTDDVAFFDKNGKEIKLGDITPEHTYLVYYPQGGSPKFYVNGSPEFSLSSIYADGMVLQRGREINLAGFSNIMGMTVKATLTDADGELVAEGTSLTAAERFSVTLPALTAAKGLTLKITVTNETETFFSATFRDVAIGEVWLLGGQSNMWLPTHMLEDAEEYLANADNYGDNIRYFYQARKASFTPETDTVDGAWLVATEKNLRTTEISGIGYVCATRLAAELGDVPIAVIDVYYAGSSIVAWFDLDTIKAEYPDLYTSYESKLGTTPSSWNTIPSVCYNRMVNPIKGYTAAGMLWYQGESDCGNSNYASYYKTLTSLWREWTRNDALPFVVMQLAPYASSSYPSFRSLQYNMVADDPYSYLISTTEDGPVFNMADNINGYGYAHVHPARKSGIGLRAADMILGEVYGIDLGRAHKAPELLSVSRDGSSVILRFGTDLMLLHGTRVDGFMLNGVAATGVIDGKTLTLTASGVTEPTTVSYAQDALTVVMKDGTVYRNVSNVVVSEDRQTTSFRTADGQTVTVGAGSHDVIRSTYGGNLTNSSGYAMPAFSLSVTAE